MKLFQRGGQQPQAQQSEHGFDGQHTPDSPYCGDPSCWCHLDWQYHEQAIQAPEMSDEEFAFALTFLTGEVQA